MNREFVQELIDAPSCCAELKKVATDWLNNLADDEELIEEIRADVTSIDELISFTESELGKNIFGEERAKAMNELAKEAKENGETYCTCPACQACKKILENA